MCRGSIPPLRRCVASSVDMLGLSVGSAISPSGCDSRGNLLCFNICARPRGIKAQEGNNFPIARAEGSGHEGRGESGWCSDMTSTHWAWRHAGARFLLSGGRWPKPPSVRQSSWVKPASRSEPKATRSMAMEIHCQCLKHSWVSETHMAAWSSGMILA